MKTPQNWAATSYYLFPVIIFFLSVVGLFRLGFDLPSHMSENEFAVVVIPPAGANLEANDEVMRGIEAMLKEADEVEAISTTVRKDEPRLYVTLIKDEQRERSRKEISDTLKEEAEKFAKTVHQDYSIIIDEGISVDASKQLVINIFGAELTGEGGRESHQGEFADAINRDGGEGAARGLVDDLAAAAFAHRGHHGLNTIQCAGHIHIHDAVPLVECNIHRTF